MLYKTPHTPLLACILTALSTFGCATDHVDAAAFQLATPAASSVDGLAPFIIGTAIESKDQEFTLLINGRKAVIEGEDQLTIHPGENVIAASLPAGDYVIELLDPEENVVLRTPGLSYRAGHANVLFIHGPLDSLDHLYHSTNWIDVAADKLLVLFGNATAQRATGKLESCTAAGACTELDAAVAFGAGVSAQIAPDNHLAFSPDVAGGDQLAIRSTVIDIGSGPLLFQAFYLIDWNDPDHSECPGCGRSSEFGERRFAE